MGGKTSEEVIDLARQKGIKIVDLKFTDLPGTLQHFSIPVSELTTSAFEEGLGFDGSSIRGFQQIPEPWKRGTFFWHLRGLISMDMNSLN